MTENHQTSPPNNSQEPRTPERPRSAWSPTDIERVIRRLLIAVSWKEPLMLVLGCIMLLLALIVPKSTDFLCQVPRMKSVIPACQSITIPNVSVFLKTQMQTMDSFGLARAKNHSWELFQIRSAMDDLKTQVQHSDLNEINRKAFTSTLDGLVRATTDAAKNMELLEAKVIVNFRYFVEYSQSIQRSLVQLSHSSDKELVKELVQELETNFLQVMDMTNDGMESLEEQAGKVKSSYDQMEEYLRGAYSIYIQESKAQKNLAEAWVEYGKESVQPKLLVKNLRVLQQFEDQRPRRREQVNRMATAVELFRAEIYETRQKVKATLLDTNNIANHIKEVNLVIDTLKRKYGEGMLGTV